MAQSSGGAASPVNQSGSRGTSGAGATIADSSSSLRRTLPQDWEDATPPGRARAADAIESLSILLIGFLAMSFFYHPPGKWLGPDMGVTGNDSFYHVRMATKIPEWGLVKKFPWLQFSYFTNSGDDFVSHHYGFHVLLLPFVIAARAWSGNELDGARWAICTFFGLSMVLFHALLRGERVRYPLIWVLLFLLMPIQFYTRHAYVRAISPSLFAMLLLCWAMFRGRWLTAAIVTALYNHLYLGAVMYSPVIVGAYAAACLVDHRETRRFPWRLVIATAIGWVVGVLTYPYVGGMFEFLKLQVFGTGLTPDIDVGTEWKPYTDLWWFVAVFAGPILAIWTVSLLTRLRLGPRLTAVELTLVMLNFAFLLLTIKARRFIEYWPAFCLLSAAVMSKPGVAWIRGWFEDAVFGDGTKEGLITTIVYCAVGVFLTGYFVLYLGPKVPKVAELVHSSRFWRAVCIGLCLPFVTSAIRAHRQWRSAVMGRIKLFPFATAVTALGSVAGSTMWVEVRKSSTCDYNVPEIRRMMAAIRADSRPGDVIFTSDWDDFPVYFYYNTYNYYIVGLDPKFTHERRPDLWERFVRITRGEVPTTSEKMMNDAAGKKVRQRLEIRVEDIRDYFHARYVISDSGHRALSTKVAGAEGFAEMIYPPGGWSKNRNAPYVVFRINDAPANSQGAAEPGR